MYKPFLIMWRKAAQNHDSEKIHRRAASPISEAGRRACGVSCVIIFPAWCWPLRHGRGATTPHDPSPRSKPVDLGCHPDRPTAYRDRCRAAVQRGTDAQPSRGRAARRPVAAFREPAAPFGRRLAGSRNIAWPCRALFHLPAATATPAPQTGGGATGPPPRGGHAAPPSTSPLSRGHRVAASLCGFHAAAAQRRETLPRRALGGAARTVRRAAQFAPLRRWLRRSH